MEVTHQVDPEAIRNLGYKVTDLYASVVYKANALPKRDRDALFRIMSTVLSPFMEGIEELARLGENLIVEVDNE